MQPAVFADVEHRKGTYPLSVDVAVAHKGVTIERHHASAFVGREGANGVDRVVVVGVQHEERRITERIGGHGDRVGRADRRRLHHEAQAHAMGRRLDRKVLSHRVMTGADHEQNVGDARVGQGREDIIEKGTLDRNHPFHTGVGGRHL